MSDDASPDNKREGSRTKKFAKGFLTQRLRSLSSPPVPLKLDLGSLDASTGSRPSSGDSNKSLTSSIPESPTAESPNPFQRGRRGSMGSVSMKRSASGPPSWGGRREPPQSNAVTLLGEFKQMDLNPQRQRQVLVALERKRLAAEQKEKADKRKVSVGVREKLKNALFAKGNLREANKIFLLAMANAMEPVCTIMMDKGFPADVNAPVIKSEDSLFTAPSYFMLCVGLRLHNLVFHMIQHHRVKVNADWYGVTALHVAASKGSLTVVNMLLEQGANPRQGIPVANFRLLRKLKNAQPKDKTAAIINFSRLSTAQRSPTNSINGPSTPPPAAEHVNAIDIALILQDQEMVNVLLARMKPSKLSASSLHLLQQADMELGKMSVGSAGVGSQPIWQPLEF
ncbi:hypothetical protein PhCBS80983_g06432 [Powellomyces hirtus]|uniref:Uncharacterized protein n=1 Tax=Powellomyces hirtus TaxID=109895 RepID=A0A507DMP4_9FUNG|nr:hypothetical protein PhCBS80983_g06432 [Powellomyces hirtus]